MSGYQALVQKDGVTPVDSTNPLPVTSVAAGNVPSGSADSGNPVKVAGVYNSTPPTFTTGQRGDLQVDSRGALHVTLFTPDAPNVPYAPTSTDVQAGTSGLSALLAASRGYIFNGATWDRAIKPNATSRIVSAAATTNATSAKASAGQLHSIDGWNAAAALRYLKIYNKASAPTVGTDTPVLTLPLPPGARFQFWYEGGYYCSTGIAYAMTVGVADGDTAALTAADVLALNIAYS